MKREKQSNFDDDGFKLEPQIYLKLEAFPVEIQYLIFANLSPAERVRIERVSKIWFSLVRKNGWSHPAIHLDCRCVRNFDRFQQIGFGPRLRQLVLNIDIYDDCGDEHRHRRQDDNEETRTEEEEQQQAVTRNDLSHREEIAQFFRISAFPNLVHLRIDPACTRDLMKTKIFEEIAELKTLKSLSLGRFSDTYMGFDFYFPPLEMFVMDWHPIDGGEEDLYLLDLCSLVQQQPLRSVWLDGGYDKLHAYSFLKLFSPGICHLGLGRMHLTREIVLPMCHLKSLHHLGFLLPACYHAHQLDPLDCAHPESSILNLYQLRDIFTEMSASLVSLEIDGIGPRELSLVINCCKLLQHLAFKFIARKEPPIMDGARIIESMRELPSALVHLRSLDIFLHEPIRSFVNELLEPIMLKLAAKGRIEYLSVKLCKWDDEKKESNEMLLSDHVALQFVRHCNNLRYLGHIFQDHNSGEQLTQILDVKLATGERRPVASNNNSWLNLPKQRHQFSQLLVAFCEEKPRNHVFCAIRAQGLTSAPPDFFFTTPLLHKKCADYNLIDDEDGGADNQENMM